MFTPEQINELKAPLSSSHVKKREGKYSYIEGWHAIAEANRIFGFDGWTRETVDVKCVAERERKVGQGEGWGVTYIARVRIMVGTITREGCGTGHGIDRDLGQAHEGAIKEAETDAMKRALMTFGNPFGLALYDKQQREVSNDEAPTAIKLQEPPPPPRAAVPKVTPASWAKDSIALVKRLSQTDLDEWSDKNNAAMVKLRGSDPASHKLLMEAIRDRYAALEPIGAG